MKVVNTKLAYDFIRDKILNGAYPPGLSLSARDLSKEIGVSRTPVRDAMRQLEADGFLIIQPYLRAAVKSMSLAEFTDICGLRQGLETYAAGQAARQRTEAELSEIRRAFEALCKIQQQMLRFKGDIKRVQHLVQEDVREDIRFHLAIVTASRNKAVKNEIVRLQLVGRIVAPAFFKFALPMDEHILNARMAVERSHREIFEAIAKRDQARAKDAMERHLQSAIDALAPLIGRR